MKPLETLASVRTPQGRCLSLLRRDREFFIHLDGEELMSSRRHGSEAALAERALRELAHVRAPRVLIGGLGLGYTLRAALAVLPQRARIVVAEIFPDVVAWNRKEVAEPGRPLDDPRVRVLVADVAAVLTERHAAPWHAILLDVDNGPSAWCLGSNKRLYDRPGLARIRSSLVPGGILGVWSAVPDPAFLERLRRAGLDARVEEARARGRRGARSFLFLGRA